MLRRLFRPGPVVLGLVVAVAIPASAGSPPSNVGAATVPGLSTNFDLVGHTDLPQRGMNSPIAVAGGCAYVGARFSPPSRDEAVPPSGGIAIVDISAPATPGETGTIPP